MQTVGQLFRAMLDPLTVTLKQHLKFIIMVVSLILLELVRLRCCALCLYGKYIYVSCTVQFYSDATGIDSVSNL